MKKVLFLLITLFHIIWISAQDFDIYKIGVAQGLSQGMVTSMIQDSDGFIWIGTLSGLNRYDGNRFKVFTHNPNDPYSPSGNLVTGLLQDSEGRIWVGYQEGLDCYIPKTGRFYHLGTAYNVFNKKGNYLGTLN
ncbi:hypothetical protein C7N43_09440 [Sphingobacteriales bacterium UPWRP_1]|nr:hypothetical protein B6N25_06845 [Sphingobacteriales bacterium TSM_CSS]PSJ77260.1 hypothetical protein C7N43_09440 [Sphingobacteriales bacterium UPWRP_1]